MPEPPTGRPYVAGASILEQMKAKLPSADEKEVFGGLPKLTGNRKEELLPGSEHTSGAESPSGTTV
jgi:hypothetical protein